MTMIVVVTYSVVSGMWGVAVSDAIQFCLAMAGCIWLAVIAVNRVGGVDSLARHVEQHFGSREALGYLPDFGSSDPWMPLHVFLIMLTMQWWATWYPGAEPGGGGYVVQRMAAIRTPHSKCGGKVNAARGSNVLMAFPHCFALY